MGSLREKVLGTVFFLVATALPVLPAFGAEQDTGELPAAAAPQDGGESGSESDAPSPKKRVRDPFRPFSLDFRPTQVTKPKTPLEQYDLGSLTLVAVIWNVSDPKAMVEDDTGLGYTVGVGTPIGRSGGIVKKIDPDRVLIEEESTDFYGQKQKTEKVLKLKTEGEKRP